eukprot:COSAG05_NODE_5639_length_1124_cov_1.572683_1_plen_180_part_10
MSINCTPSAYLLRFHELGAQACQLRFLLRQQFLAVNSATPDGAPSTTAWTWNTHTHTHTHTQSYTCKNAQETVCVQDQPSRHYVFPYACASLHWLRGFGLCGRAAAPRVRKESRTRRCTHLGSRERWFRRGMRLMCRACARRLTGTATPTPPRTPALSLRHELFFKSAAERRRSDAPGRA